VGPWRSLGVVARMWPPWRRFGAGGRSRLLGALLARRPRPRPLRRRNILRGDNGMSDNARAVRRRRPNEEQCSCLVITSQPPPAPLAALESRSRGKRWRGVNPWRRHLRDQRDRPGQDRSLGGELDESHQADTNPPTGRCQRDPGSPMLRAWIRGHSTPPAIPFCPRPRCAPPANIGHASAGGVAAPARAVWLRLVVRRRGDRVELRE
jgi:hypothetical protein